ncbi:hypothetical protein KPC83_02995 [Collinsella sp. zg1085]|uniref:hypothetical protein n=1 Tax=Collinsella sp. zg1085 TaxID=2844380 RepID=UPI001C0C47B3|nr:hypothetical protein [Collinsella sp. zg1085]QWT18112.1 hypothetical protein KPC83_02995 [Collinsella sp. zg1085]
MIENTNRIVPLDALLSDANVEYSCVDGVLDETKEALCFIETRYLAQALHAPQHDMLLRVYDLVKFILDDAANYDVTDKTLPALEAAKDLIDAAVFINDYKQTLEHKQIADSLGDAIGNLKSFRALTHYALEHCEYAERKLNTDTE